MDPLITKLNDLVANGDLGGYLIEDLDEIGNPGESKFRNSQRLTIQFPSGDKIMLGTFCSGSHENTGFVIHEPEKELSQKSRLTT